MKKDYKDWFLELLDFAEEEGYWVNTEDPEIYREYYNEGCSPADALRSEQL